MIDPAAIVWTDDKGRPVDHKSDDAAIMHVSGRYLISKLEFMAEEPTTLDEVDAPFMDLDPEVKEEVIKSFLAGPAWNEIRATEKALKESQ